MQQVGLDLDRLTLLKEQEGRYYRGTHVRHTAVFNVNSVRLDERGALICRGDGQSDQHTSRADKLGNRQVLSLCRRR